VTKRRRPSSRRRRALARANSRGPKPIKHTGPGGRREGAGRDTLWPGKVAAGKFLTKRVYGVLTAEAFAALDEKRRALSEKVGRSVSTNETLEWCIRKAMGLSIRV
jgi:hypothetical protein